MKSIRSVLSALFLIGITAGFARIDYLASLSEKSPSNKSHSSQAAAGEATTFTAAGVIKGVDRINGTITLALTPIETLRWLARSRSFAIKKTTLLDPSVGEKVELVLIKEGDRYVVSEVTRDEQ